MASKRAKPIDHREIANHCEVCLAYAGKGQHGNIKKQKVLMYRVHGPGLPSVGEEMCRRHWEEYRKEEYREEEESSASEEISSEDYDQFTIKPMSHREIPNTCETCLAYAKKGEVSKIKEQKVLMFRVYGPGLSSSGKEVCAKHKED